MDPASAIGLASAILTFIDIGYKVVAGTLETAQTSRAPHTEHIDVVAQDLNNAVVRFSQAGPPNASDPEKALKEVSAKCQALSMELLALLDRFKVSAEQTGITWETFKVTIRRIRNDSKVQDLQKSLADYRSQILVHLVTILTDRQLATQVQLGNSFGETRTDLRCIRDALDALRTEVFDKLEHVQTDLGSHTRRIPNAEEPLADQNALVNKLEMQFQEVKDALDLLTGGRSEKTAETRILEYVYFGNSMFQREDTLKPADETTFRWFVEGVASNDATSSGLNNMGRANRGQPSRSSHVQKKAEVASRFENWLRSGSGVFHISGKAGSGKSTLMKLILSTERTYELLGEWASGRRLLFARFYFWAGGSRIQNSLEGLHRSILFEILIRRPELVKEVFHEAHTIVAHSSWDSPIHSRFFTAASFQKAFGRLLLLPSDPRYRLCLFIDGLDEYGADVSTGSLPETQREDLAQGLVTWATNAHVKILASSRPYPEFSDAFPEEQRVHLHRLTHDDMIEFGRHLFERHRSFRFPGVKDRYTDLVDKVVHVSDGVFLWTGLTIQRLLASLARRDSFESLERQLEATPRELNALYEKMFSGIDEHDRFEAMKMMLLVSEEQKCLGGLSQPGGVNAMAISWLDSLERPEFPADQPFLVYTKEEIEQKREFAETRVNGYTRGLLEVISHFPEDSHDYSWPPNLRHTVQFFHKTALEYVAASPLARDILSSSPHLFNLEFYTRLSLAELHFGCMRNKSREENYFERYPYILAKYIATARPRRPFVEAYRAAFEQQAKYGAWKKHYISLGGHSVYIEASRDGTSPSFDHWLAHEVRGTYTTNYLMDRMNVLSELRRPQDLSLLLSAACRQPGEDPTLLPIRLDRVKVILAHGADLNHVIRLRLEFPPNFIDLSVWQTWCLYYVANILVTPESFRATSFGDDNLDMHQILQTFLETGIDSDCHILMVEDRSSASSYSSRDLLNDSLTDLFSDVSRDESEGNTSGDSQSESGSSSDESTQQWIPTDKWRMVSIRRRPSKTAYVVSLGDFIRQVKPANFAQLEPFLGRDDHTPDLAMRELGQIQAELATSQHPQFSFPTVRPVDLNDFFSKARPGNLVVYWIRWKDATIPAGWSLKLRLY